MAKQSSHRLLYLLGGIMVALLVMAIIGKSLGWIGKDKPLEVTTARVDIGQIIEKVSASGKVQPETEVKLSPEVSGEITDLLVREGDSVVKGQLLVKIRPDTYESLLEVRQAGLNNARASLAQSRARLAQAKANNTQMRLTHERNRKLHADKVISEADFEASQANFTVSNQELEAAVQTVKAAEYGVQSALASVKEARENLLKTTIYAPVSGTVSKLSVQQGERVVGTLQMAGTELMRIANLNTMEVRVNVNENDIIRINLNDSVIIDVDSYSGRDQKFRGVVTAIANTAKDALTLEAVTEFEVRIRILNESYRHLVKHGSHVSPFRPGMTASVEIITERKDQVLRVPLSAVTTRTESQLAKEALGDKVKQRPDRKGPKSNAEKPAEDGKPQKSEEVYEVVYKVENGKAAMMKVKTGISDIDYIEVLSGLNKGDEVVTGPFRAVSKQLKDGLAVEVKDKSDLTKKSDAPAEDDN